jgi:molybdopterin converting factor small subunit
MDIRESRTIGELLVELLNQFPKLANYKLLFAVNEEYAGINTQLNGGDEVAIFTAVSGG